jgi:hypothetical protein
VVDEIVATKRLSGGQLMSIAERWFTRFRGPRPEVQGHSSSTSPLVSAFISRQRTSSIERE